MTRATCLEITDCVCPVAVSVTVSVAVSVLSPVPGHSQIFPKLFFLGLVHSIKLFQHVTRMLIHLTWQLEFINFDKDTAMSNTDPHLNGHAHLIYLYSCHSMPRYKLLEAHFTVLGNTSTSNPFLCDADFFLQLGSCKEAVR